MGFFSNIFNNNTFEFKEVRIDVEVIDSVIHYSKQSYPNEFLSLFDGFIKDEILYITDLIFIPGETCETGAVFRSDLLPMSLSNLGTVHCHPGPSASPSDADLRTFSKHGVFHMIVCLPYSKETFKAYDKYGNPMNYTIGDYSDIIEQEDNLLDFFDEDDVVGDDEVLKAGFFDEEDIIEDDEKIDYYTEFEKKQQPQIIISSNNHSNNVALKMIIDENGNRKFIPYKYK